MLGDFHKTKDDGMFPDSNKAKNKFLQKEREMFLLSLNAVKTGLLIILQKRSLQPYFKVERVRARRSSTGRLFHSTELHYS